MKKDLRKEMTINEKRNRVQKKRPLGINLGALDYSYYSLI
jgi:hypothetical protein